MGPKSLGEFKGKEKGDVVGSHLKDWVSQVPYNGFIVLFCLAQVRGNSASSILKALFKGFSFR